MKNNSKNAENQTDPLVSIICRSINRPQLTEALRSVRSQTYKPVEIVLVDSLARGISKDLYQDCIDEIRLITPDQPLGRAAAANTGLDNVRGDYLMFLDDDDWIAPEHVAGLVKVLQAESRYRAAYSSVCKTTFDGTETDEVFERDYDPVLLRRDNYIPIHAVLFERSLTREGCRFDESFDIYEDWDFWLQVSQLTRLKHLSRLTAYYRHGGGSDTGIVENDLRFTAGHPIADARQRIYEKWKHLWSGAEINELIGSLDSTREMQALNDKADQLNDKADQFHDALIKETTRSNERQEQLNLLKSSLDYLKHSAAGKIQELEAGKRESKIALWHRDIHIKELEERLNDIYSSLSWRVMGPFRKAERLIRFAVLNPLRRRLHFFRYGTEWKPHGSHQQKQLTGKQLAATAPDINTQANLKSQYRAQAENNLKHFIDNGLFISFRQTDNPRVSILLVLYNQAPLSLLCLESIIQYAPYPYEVVIIDNASSDDSGAMLKGIHNVRLVRNETNEGFVRAVNQGAALCRGDYILLLNNDALLHHGSIESALDTIESVPEAGAVGGRILLLDGALQEAGSFIFADGSCLGYGRHQNPESPEYRFRRPVDYCSGAFLLFSAALFREMGGFDNDYAPAYYEDSDFCIRLQKRGLKVVYDPDAVITHYEFASSGGQSKASELQTKHRAVLVSKHRDYLATRVQASAANLLSARCANQNLNVLCIDDRVPHPSLGSGYPRSCEMINVLASAAVNLTFYPLQFPEETWQTTYQTLPGNIEVMLHYGNIGLADFLVSRKDFYDYIIVSRIHNMKAFQSCLQSVPDLLGRTRIIYDAEAVTAPREIRYRELHGEIVSEAEKSRLMDEEMSTAKLADSILCVSTREAEIFNARGYGNTRVLGHSLDTRPFIANAENRHDLLFVGALRDENSPNVDSLHWFIEKVLPILRRKLPAIKLLVIGDNTAPSLAKIRDPAIVMLGRQADLAKHYESARVFIAPTRFAAGIPHKVHEAAAHGIPCVTTALLADQLGWVNDMDLLVADSAEEFAAACERLYLDKSLWNRIRGSALEKIIRDCSAEKFKSQLLAAIGLQNKAQG